MKNLLVIKNIVQDQVAESTYVKVSEHSNPNSTYKDIVKVIKELNNDNKLGASNYNLTYNNLIDRLLKFGYYSLDVESIDEYDKYIIYIEYHNDYILIKAYDKYGVQFLIKKYVIKWNIKGNCVDDFINRGVEPSLESIQDVINDIKSRKGERSKFVEYHRTGCYEKDFSQILLIKELAENIANNCNNHLERISEFYTRL